VIIEENSYVNSGIMVTIFSTGKVMLVLVEPTRSAYMITGGIFEFI
jgi:hypothetical protein